MNVRTGFLSLTIAAVAAPLHAQAPVPITLPEALARGRSNGVQSAMAHLAAKGTLIRRNELGAAMLPQVEMSGTVQRQTINLREFGLDIPGFPAVTDPFTLFRGRVGASQVIFDRSIVERLRTARDTAVAAGLDAEHAGDISAAAAGAAWLRLASAQETVIAREADSVTAYALRDVAGSLVDAGTAPRIDRTRSETQAAAVQLRIAIARNERDRARLDLARAVDLPPGTPLVVAAEVTFNSDSLPASVDAAIALAKEHRADLAAERSRQEVLERSLAGMRSEFLPTIAASGYAQTSGVRVADLAGTWNIGIGFNWSLFDGYRRNRRIDEQRLRIDAGKLRLHNLEAEIEADVRQAVLDVASGRDQLSLANAGVRLAEQELSEARERFSAGVTGSVETTNAQAELAAARDALINARLAAGAAQINAARALGLLNNVH